MNKLHVLFPLTDHLEKCVVNFPSCKEFKRSMMWIAWPQKYDRLEK